MLPTLTQLSISATSTGDKRDREGDGFPAQGDSLQVLLSDLPPDIKRLVMLAVQANDCKELGRICQINREFRSICNSQDFWKALLITKGWWPLYDAGLSLDEWYKLLCNPKVLYHHRVALLALKQATTVIEYRTFAGCTPLNLKKLPPEVNDIGEHAFYQCTVLNLDSLPPNLVRIGVGAFSGCVSLSLTTLPDSLIMIRANAFKDAVNLALEELPPNLDIIGPHAFENCKNLVLDKQGASPSKLQRIEKAAFKDCESLALTMLPDTLTHIGPRAFDGCENLALEKLPPSVRYIGDGAFARCTNLTNEEFVDAVLRMNKFAFEFDFF